MLRGLDIPQDQPHPAPRTRPNPPKDPKQPPRTPKEAELKPFKRQSYHVAIAYHIHIKNVRARNGSDQEVDPTYHARKLRVEAENGNLNQDRKVREEKERERRKKDEDRRR